ncbi:hydrolase [Microlunatus endophyticus]|uniref:Hydrolase n=1 Tax=Microlunatus endophyticus TaxID=1716077 RepID=A0A917W6E0_9ACTN|nr:amidohydrolase family protein [Microlunatus endophyticus]GGL75373.1 hydrolase [Microlunatus endophyticus]
MPAEIFSNARVFDGETFIDKPVDVVVDDRRFVEIGPGLAGQERYGAAVVHDLAGKTLLPGLFDCHVHVMMSMAGGVERYTKPYSMQYYESVNNLTATLQAGITTVREASGADLGTKTAVETGVIPGPRMKIAVTMLSQTGGHGDGWLPSGIDAGFAKETAGRPNGICDGVEEVRKTVRRVLRAGADQIKISSTGGVLSHTDDPRHTQFTQEEIAVIVGEAEHQDTYVMAHAQGAPGIKNALRAGVRSIEHGIFLDDECIQLMLDKDAFLVPTLVAPIAVIRNAERGIQVPQRLIDKARSVSEAHREAFARAVDAGVRIAMGTDSGVGRHGENLEELVLMADGGMSLEEVLAATTSQAAELMFLDDTLGKIAPGHLADLVVLDGELTSARQLGSLQKMIDEVWKNGTRVI